MQFFRRYGDRISQPTVFDCRLVVYVWTTARQSLCDVPTSTRLLTVEANERISVHESGRAQAV